MVHDRKGILKLEERLSKGFTLAQNANPNPPAESTA